MSLRRLLVLFKFWVIICFLMCLSCLVYVIRCCLVFLFWVGIFVLIFLLRMGWGSLLVNLIVGYWNLVVGFILLKIFVLLLKFFMLCICVLMNGFLCVVRLICCVYLFLIWFDVWSCCRWFLML